MHLNPAAPPSPASVAFAATAAAMGSLFLAATPATAQPRVIISELNYHPMGLPEPSAREFVEIYNAGDEPADLTGYRFNSGIDYTFGAVELAAGDYLVVAAHELGFLARYPGRTNYVAPWTGRLANSGERVRLVDADGATVDAVTYADGGDWARRVRGPNDQGTRGWTWESLADGGGRSLELINPALSNNPGANWGESVAEGGTPGEPNSIASADIAPLILEVGHEPALPRSSDRVTVRAEVIDEAGVSGVSVALRWRVSERGGGAPFAVQPMTATSTGGGRFATTLPAHSAGTVIEYYIEASDASQTRTWPAPSDEGQNVNALLQFDDELYPGAEPVYRLVLTADERATFEAIDRNSDAQMNATLVVADGGGFAVRHRCGMRVRGASSRRDDPPPLRVNLPSDAPWNGFTEMNLNTQFTWLQFLGMKLFAASGLRAPDARRVQVRLNGVNGASGGQTDYGSYVHVEPLGSEFLARHFPHDPGGNLYKKVRPDTSWAYRNGDFGDYADDGWSKSSRASADDWSDLDEFLRVMNNAPGQPGYLGQVEAVADLDQWMLWFGVMTLIANGETNASNGTDDDYSMYRGLEDPRFQFVPHDLDTILGQGDGSSIRNPEHTLFDMVENGITLEPLEPLFDRPEILRRYFEALRTLTQTSFSKRRFDEFVRNGVRGWVPEGTTDAIIAFVDARRAYVEAEVAAVLGPPDDPVPALNAETLEAPAPGDLRVSEVSAGGGGGGSGEDWVELTNTGAATVVLEGFGVSDAAGRPGRYRFAAGAEIAPGAFLVITASELGFGLDADGDDVFLTDGLAGGDAVLDAVSFGPQPDGYTIARTGGGGTWSLARGRLGEANQAAELGPPADLRINEWLARPEVLLEDDFVELYNTSDLPVAIGRMAVSDDAINRPGAFAYPDLSYIGPRAYVVAEPGGGRADLPFALDGDGDWINLISANGVTIDQVMLVDGHEDHSVGRAPDGGGAYASFALPTPGAPNPEIQTRTEVLVDWDAVWAYDDTDRDPGPGWTDPAYNDVGWARGAGVLGVENAALAAPLATVLQLNPPTTHYFRHAFDLGPGGADGATFELLLDDAGIVYLNGTEVLRRRMPAGEITHQMFSQDDVFDAAVEGPFAIPAGLLQPGRNVLAARVHQDDGTSSDVVFGLRASVSVESEPYPAYAAALEMIAGLRVTEIFFHPPDGAGEIEFIELQNVGATPLQLGGLRFTEGISFTFPERVLEPGERIVVVENEAAFEAVHGAGINVAGAYLGKLDNGGERLRLQLAKPFEAAVIAFRYDDDPYPEADGGGRSLVVIDSSAPARDYGQASNWVAGGIDLGSPGAAGPPRVIAPPSVAGVQGEPFYFLVRATEEPESYEALGLPEGLAIDAVTGAITGITSGVGSFQVLLRATNAAGDGLQVTRFDLSRQPPPTFTVPAAVTALLGTPFSYTLTASGQPTTTFAAPELPGWLSLDTGTGELSGTPPAAGSFSFLVEATNFGGTTQRTLTLNVIAEPLASALDAGGLEFRTGGDADWETVGGDESHDGVDAVAVGGMNPGDDAWIETTIQGPDVLTFWWQLITVPGFTRNDLILSLDGDERITVTARGFNGSDVQWEMRSINIPAGSHVVRWTLDVRGQGNAIGATATIDEVTLQSFASRPEITVDGATTAVLGVGFSYAVDASRQPSGYSAFGLPAGLSIDPLTGVISGEPATPGTYSVLLTAENGAGTGSATLSLEVTPPPDLGPPLGVTGLTWGASGDAAWAAAPGAGPGGGDAVRSGAVGDGAESVFATTVTGPGRIGFQWRISAGAGATVELLLDGQPVLSRSGEQPWTAAEIDLTPGAHQVAWTFRKDASGPAGADAAWAAAVELTGYAAWVAENGLSAGTAPGDDPDRDGIPNLLEIAFGLAPAAHEVRTLPAPELIGGHLMLDLAKPPGAAGRGVVYQVEISDDLGQWSTVGTSVLTDDDTRLTVRDETPVAAGRARFMRVRVRLE